MKLNYNFKCNGRSTNVVLVWLGTYLLLSLNCKKFVQVDAPSTSISSSNVYNDDATAVAVLTGLYVNLSQSNFATGMNSISVFSALSADELSLYNGIPSTSNLNAYYRNQLIATSSGIEVWNDIYPFIFICNSALDGLSRSSNLTPAIQRQLIGEAKFMRAFCYFYLINLYGDVPLALTTDFVVNASLARTSKTLVYQQIVSDLLDAQNLLATNYLDGSLLKSTTERVRPTKFVATALLSRVYLFMGDFVDAEKQATLIISNASLYGMQPISSAFIRSVNNTEVIWQIQSVIPGYNTLDAITFILPSTGLNINNPFQISASLLNAFEVGDLRRNNWIDSVIISGVNYYYPYKYRQNTTTATTISEYLIVFRLSEQYLIRSEARAQQGNLTDAVSDINVVRNRAGLNNLAVTTQTDILTRIQHERQVELFTEWGHRWLDLKRTGNIDIVMNQVVLLKGGTWNSNWQWYPVPTSDIQKDVNLTQNAGYQ